jgi:polysaccharide biosynthesis transport protein
MSEDDDAHDLRLGDIWRIVIRRKGLVVVAALACAGAALVMTAMQDPVYRAESRMALRTLPGDTVFGSGEQSSRNAQRAIETEIQVLQSDAVRRQVVESLGLTKSPPVAVGKAVGTADVIAVSVRSGSPQSAQTLADAYVLAYIETRRVETQTGLSAAIAQLEKRIAVIEARIQEIDDAIQAAPADEREQVARDSATRRTKAIDQINALQEPLDQLEVDASLSSGGAQLVQPAPLPSEPIEPNPPRTVLLALIAGLVIGLAAAFVLDRLDGSVRSSADLELASGHAPILSVVASSPVALQHPLALHSPGDAAVEAYRTLRTNLQFLGLEQPLKIIQVTSAMPGDGKSTTAANLAVVFAQAGSSVLLIDADLRRPKLHQLFGIDGAAGLTNALLGDPLELLPVEVSVDGGRLHVLAAGKIPSNPSELLGGKRMKSMLAQLAEKVDIVILDSPPLLAITDSVALSGRVDAVVLVASDGLTSRRQVAEAVAALSRVSAPFVGTVMNRVSVRRMRSGDFGSGNSDGYGYGYSSPAQHST